MKIGLALSGGIARGPAHIGVLEALSEAGIQIDIVAGSSAGALIGYGYCAGISLRLWHELAGQISWFDFARLHPHRNGLLTFDKLEQWLEDIFGDLSFQELSKPLIISVTDLDTGLPHVIENGFVAPAVHASCSVPGFVSPVVINDRRFVDGGISNNLPAKPLVERGADMVIGVDLFQPNTQWPIYGVGFGITAIEMMVRRSGCGAEHCRVIVIPELSGVSYLNMHNVEYLVRLGRDAMFRKLPDVEKILALGSVNQ